jgi:hypothetical protein
MAFTEVYTDQIEAIGAVRRFYFRALDDSGEWHYWGTTAIDVPPPGEAVVNEYPYVQLPKDLDDLGPAYEGMLWDIAFVIGPKKEGVES